MAEKFYNKLVRDKIPEIIKDTGETPIARVLTDEEYKIALLEKLIEEARELLESIGSLEERADVGEVLSALDEVFGWSASDITKARDTKNNRKGGFSKKLYLEKTIGA